jgi:hypothetical protein
MRCERIGIEKRKPFFKNKNCGGRVELYQFAETFDRIVICGIKIASSR